MNFSKKTLFWIIFLLVLSGVFYFSEQEAEQNRLATEKSLKLFNFTAQDVTEFWITYLREGRELRVLRSHEGWQVIEPLSAKGDTDTIQQLLTNVITARKDAVLFDHVDQAKLEELGLDNPELEIGFNLGDRDIVIQFGVSGPTHNVAYAMLKGKTKIFRIHADVREEVRVEVYDLRDKTILDIDPMKMRRFVIEPKGANKVVVEQNKGRWQLLEPEKKRASMDKVVETLFEIKNTQIKLFKEESASDLTPYGLDAPKLKLTIFEEKNELPYILSIGDKDRTNRGYFAHTNQAENIFVVEEGLVNAILRNKDKLAE